ncbi:hypothetical protein Bca4012_092971 [Brassica carinata]
MCQRWRRCCVYGCVRLKTDVESCLGQRQSTRGKLQRKSPGLVLVVFVEERRKKKKAHGGSMSDETQGWWRKSCSLIRRRKRRRRVTVVGGLSTKQDRLSLCVWRENGQFIHQQRDAVPINT